MWKKIKEAPNYEINRGGDVRRIRNKKLLKPRVNSAGRVQYALRAEGRYVYYQAHRLVYCTFNDINLEFTGMNTVNCVCHKDDNPLNNRLENLFIATQAGNIKDMDSKGRRVFRANVIEDKEKFILLRDSGYTQDEIAKEIGCSKITVQRFSKKHGIPFRKGTYKTKIN